MTARLTWTMPRPPPAGPAGAGLAAANSRSPGRNALVDQPHAKALKIQIQSRADPDLRAAQDENVLSDFGYSLPQGTEEARPDQSCPEEIPGPADKLVFGEVLRRKMIAQVDHFEAGPVQAMLVEEMDAGAVPLVVAGDALELEGTARARGKYDPVESMLLDGRRYPAGAVGMTRGKDQLPVDHFRPLHRQLQYPSERGRRCHGLVARAEEYAQPDAAPTDPEPGPAQAPPANEAALTERWRGRQRRSRRPSS